MLKNFLFTVLFATFAFAPLSQAKTEEPADADTYELLNMFGEVMERTKASYVEEVTDKALIEASVNGMLSSLDPHSSFLNEKDFKYMAEQTKGKFGGLGIEVTMESGLVKVVSPIDDTPAFKAGLKPGDYIVEIDGAQVMGMSLNDAVEKMRGKIGSKVKLSIRRVNEKPFDVTIKRDEIKIQSVKSEIKAEDVGYIRISSFNEDTTEMVEKAVKEDQKKLKDKLKGFVIDVRNNPGGLLEQAVSVSDLFLTQGEIVSTRSRNAEDTVKYMAKDGDVAKGLPIVVLVNNGSASAAEIVSGALQDHKRAVLIGEKTFGKGSVQTVVPLGKYGAMRLTTARYYTPSGHSIQATGIVPDVEVKPAKVEILEKAFEYSEAGLGNALKNEEDPIKDLKKTDNKDDALLQDNQLASAVDMVKALGIYTQK